MTGQSMVLNALTETMAFLVLIFTELIITQYFPASIFCTENYKTQKKDVDSRPKKLLSPPPPKQIIAFTAPAFTKLIMIEYILLGILH